MKPLAYFGLGVVATVVLIKLYDIYATDQKRKTSLVIHDKSNKIEPNK